MLFSITQNGELTLRKFGDSKLLITIGRSRPSQQRKLVSDAAGRCRYGRSRRAILHRHDDCAASIRKFGLEIKNRCTKEGVNGEKLTSIPKSGPEIKNHCSLWAVSEEKLASIPKFGLEIRNHCSDETVLQAKPFFLRRRN